MKRYISIIIIAVLAVTSLFGFTACNGKSDKPKQEEKKLPAKVSLILPYEEAEADNQSETIKNLFTYFNQYAEQYGLGVSYYYSSAEENSQSMQISEAAKNDAGTIVIIPISGADLSAGLKDADKAGVPIIALHENIAKADMLRAYVGPDYKQAIDTLIEKAVKVHPDTGLVFLNGPIGDATADAFADYIKNTDVITVNSDWTSVGANAAITELVKKDTTVEAIISTNASMARGAQKALKVAKLDKTVGLYVLDASGINLDTVHAVPDTQTEAMSAAEICQKLINREAVKKTILVPFLITE